VFRIWFFHEETTMGLIDFRRWLMKPLVHMLVFGGGLVGGGMVVVASLDARAQEAAAEEDAAVAAAAEAAAAAAATAGTKEDPTRPAAIQAQDVPVVPPEVMRRLAQYGSVRTATFMGWDPAGQGILIGTRFANTVQLHRVYQPGGRREQITFFEEPVRGRFLPGSPANTVLLQMSVGGNENDQIFRWEGSNWTVNRLTDGTSRNLLQATRRDGSRIAVASNRRNGTDTDLYVLDPRDPSSERRVMENAGEYWYASDWSPDGSQLLVGRYVSINEVYPALLDVESGQRRDLDLPGDGPAGIADMVFSADGRSVYMATDAWGEFQQLLRYDLATGAVQRLGESVPWDVEEIEVDPRHGTVVFIVNEDGASTLWRVRGATVERLATPLGVLSGLEFSPDGSQLGFTLAQPQGPAEAYSMILSSGELVRWTYSEVGGLDPASFIAPTRIRFPSFDGREIPAYYFRPRQASPDKPVAVIIDIHGGPEGQYRPLFTGITQYYLNELGVAVISPNVRGSAGYGKTYLKLDNGPLREDSVHDIGALLDWIATQPELDKSRVAVMGGSYGGYMVLASLVHYGDRIRAGSDNVGIANFITFLERTAAYRRDLRRAEYGDERDPQMRAVFERINPTANAEKIRSALLVAHGINDPRVPFSEAQQIADVVRKLQRPVWTVYADNEGHGFAKKVNRDYLQAVQVLFFRQFLDLEASQP
jgi:dipeptidyl aminopeptidase/acylaminoacyl peptidase